MDVTVFGMMTTAWQGNVNAVGLIDGKIDGAEDGTADGLIVGTIDGSMDGLMEGTMDGSKDGAEVGVSERGSELHVGRPEPAHAGYTQEGVYTKGKYTNVRPSQFSMITIESVPHSLNA